MKLSILMASVVTAGLLTSGAYAVETKNMADDPSKNTKEMKDVGKTDSKHVLFWVHSAHKLDGKKVLVFEKAEPNTAQHSALTTKQTQIKLDDENVR